MTISPYTENLHIAQYLPTSYDTTLEYQVAAKNQENYNRVLNSVRNLQSQALNIQMLNQEGKQRLDEYNKQISEELSGDLGDLNKVEVQNRIANVFQTIAGDTSLIKASQLSSQYQNQIDTIDSFRQSGRKDKGYNSINETVFNEWDGGLYDFMGSSLSKITSPNFKPIKYTPFKELDTKMLNIARTLHENSSISESLSGAEGYLLHQESTGVSPERIRAMMLTQFDQEDLEQLDVMAKYEVIKNRKLGTLPDFHAKYNTYADNEIKRTQSQANTKKQQAEYFQTLINAKDTKQEDKVKYQELVTRLNEEASLYDKASNDLVASKKGLGDFEKMSNDELVQYASAIQWNNKINGLADALSWKKEVNTYKLDQVWKVNKELDAMRWREELRASTKLASDRMKGESKQPVFSGPMDTVKNTQSFFDSKQTLVDMGEQYGKLSDKVVTSPSFDSKRLLDPSFLQSNKDNYEVKMWDIFSHENPTLAIKDGQPQIEAFKLWIKDQESNPKGVAGQYIQEQQRNKVVSDWLDMKTSEINKLTREKTNDYDLLEGYPLYKADGSPLSKEEYNSGVSAYLGIPEGGGFRLVNVEDAIQEARDYTDKYVDYLDSGKTLGGLPGTPTKSKPSSYITNDRGLYERLLSVEKTKRQNNSQLEQILIGKLPQIFQQPLVEAINDEAKFIYYPEVVSAAKNVNNTNAQFGISMDDIAFIRPPVSGNKGQFQLKPKLSQDYGEMGWQLPDAVDPTKMIKIVPGGTYSFFTNKPYMPYDVLMNEIVKDVPISQGYKGYTITVSKSPTTNNTYVKVISPNGQVVDESATNQQVDVNKVIQASKIIVDTDLNKKK